MFPIRDARGRCDCLWRPGDGPERQRQIPELARDGIVRQGPQRFTITASRAKRPPGKRFQPLVVAEGYMDVIALVRGRLWQSSVAPLGTAITENQLQMLWRDVG